MWLTGQINNPMGLDSTPTPVQDHNDDTDDDPDDGNEEQWQGEEQLQGARPVFLQLLPGLPDACVNELNAQTWSLANHGIDDYVKALDIIRRHDI
jgi:hypothetical protein